MRFAKTGLFITLSLAMGQVAFTGCGEEASRDESPTSCELSCNTKDDCYYQQSCVDGCCRSLQDRIDLSGQAEGTISETEKAANTGGTCTVRGTWEISKVPIDFNSGSAYGAGGYLQKDDELGQSLFVKCWTQVGDKDKYVLKAAIPVKSYLPGAEVSLDGSNGYVKLYHEFWELTQQGDVVPGSRQSVLAGVSYGGTAKVAEDSGSGEVDQPFDIYFDVKVSKPFGSAE